eukprot:jgi/Chlat1/5266/Chrsp33S05098
MPVRVWLDVDVGSAAEAAEAESAYARAVGFLAECGARYGIGEGAGAPDDLSDDDAQMLVDAYNSDPTRSAQGPLLLRQPTPLRAGRLVIELRDDVPKAVENFRCLITGERGVGKQSGKPLHYKGCHMHRIVKGFMCQGGDIVRGDGSGGDSIYGAKFNDEKSGLKHKHDAAGVVGMANSGKNSNTSQFYVTFAPAPQLDGKHVVIGRVVEGLEVLTRIEEQAASSNGHPQTNVVVGDCGIE